MAEYSNEFVVIVEIVVGVVMETELLAIVLAYLDRYNDLDS